MKTLFVAMAITVTALGTAAAGPGAPVSDFINAKAEWIGGTQAPSATEGGYWSKAAQYLNDALKAKQKGTGGYAKAITELKALVKLPDTQQTPAQQKHWEADVTSLNAFFGTDGEYGVNAPSATPAAFVATLAQEGRIGTLSVTADPQLGTAPTYYPDAAVRCPVLSSTHQGSVFGCKMTTQGMGTYYFVGMVNAPDAVFYQATINDGSAVFNCQYDALTLAEELAAKRMGGGCKVT